MIRILDLIHSEDLKPYFGFFKEVGIGAGLIFAEVKTHFILNQISVFLDIETLEKQTVSICTMVISVCVAITAVVRLFYVIKGRKMSKEEKEALDELHRHAKANIESLEKLKDQRK